MKDTFFLRDFACTNESSGERTRNEKICSLPVDDVKRSIFNKSLLRLIWQVENYCVNHI